jgi:hypothetical protein
MARKGVAIAGNASDSTKYVVLFFVKQGHYEQNNEIHIKNSTLS